MRKPLIYIAHPYTSDPEENYADSLRVSLQVLNLGGIAINPLDSHPLHMIEPHDYSFWLANDLEIIRRCDAVFRCQGHSEGADSEVLYATAHEIPVFYDFDKLSEFIRNY